MAKAEPYVAPPDPDFEKLANDCWEAWLTDRPEVVAFDTETTGLEYHDTPFCVTVAWDGILGVEAHYLELVKHDAREIAQTILGQARLLIGHNIKFDLQKVGLVDLYDWRQLTPEQFEDTEGIAHLDNEHRPKGLKPLAVEVLGYDDTIEVMYADAVKREREGRPTTRLVSREKYELDRVRRKLGLTKDDGFHLIPRAVLVPYAIKDAEFTLGLWKTLRLNIAAFDDLSSLYDQERELTLVFRDSEEHGLGVDEEYVASMVKEYGRRIAQHELKIEAIVGKPVRTGKIPPKERDQFFNPASSDEIAKFFKARGFDRESYDEENLTGINHPLAPALLEMRGDAKLLTTYFRPLQKGTRKGVFHPSIRQHGTVTGRTSSGKERGDS